MYFVVFLLFLLEAFLIGIHLASGTTKIEFAVLHAEVTVARGHSSLCDDVCGFAEKRR